MSVRVILDKYGVSYVLEKDSIVVEYNDSSIKLLSVLFDMGKKIYINKDLDKFCFSVDKNILDREILDRDIVVNELLIKFCDMLNKCGQIRLSLKRDNYGILVDLFSSWYDCLFDECLIGNNNYYLVDKENISNLDSQLDIYNKLFGFVDIEINIKNMVCDFSYVINYYYRNEISKIIIINGRDKVDLIMVSENTIKFVFKNKMNFERVVLPEILKVYSNKIDSLNGEESLRYFNKLFYKVNDQFYMLNFYDEVVLDNISFLRELVNRKKYQLDLNKNIEFNFDIDTCENNEDIVVSRNSYSYGYVNILLISLILSLVTIVICLLKI